MSIFRHVLGSKGQGEEGRKRRRVVAGKAVDTALIVVIGILLARIVFIDGGERRITLARSVVFYVIAAAILLLRYLVLGYPVTPLLQAIVLVGIASFPILYLRERRRAPGGVG